MLSTKTLYATTLVLASVAGFSAGWTVRPGEVRVLTEEESLMRPYEECYRLSPEDRDALRAVVRDYRAAVQRLVAEFDRRYEEQMKAVTDQFDLKIGAIATPAKKRR